jgi:hypothetical protein
MRRIFQIFATILLLFLSLNAFDLYLKPHYGCANVTDNTLIDYYTTDKLNLFGFSGDIVFGKYNIGCFFDYSRFSIIAQEILYNKSYSDNIDGNWYTFGIIKHFNLDKLPIKIICRIGSTLHLNSYFPYTYDDINSKIKHSGFYCVLELNVKITKNLYIGFGSSYSNINYKFDDFREEYFTRYGYYLNNKKIQDPSIMYAINLAIRIPVDIKKISNHSLQPTLKAVR